MGDAGHGDAIHASGAGGGGTAVDLGARVMTEYTNEEGEAMDLIGAFKRAGLADRLGLVIIWVTVLICGWFILDRLLVLNFMLAAVLPLPLFVVAGVATQIFIKKYTRNRSSRGLEGRWMTGYTGFRSSDWRLQDARGVRGQKSGIVHPCDESVQLVTDVMPKIWQSIDRLRGTRESQVYLDWEEATDLVMGPDCLEGYAEWAFSPEGRSFVSAEAEESRGFKMGSSSWRRRAGARRRPSIRCRMRT